MGNGNGVSRGDRNRNAKLSGLRELVPVTNAIVGIDLADIKQMVVVCDHDSKVLAVARSGCRAWAGPAPTVSAGHAPELQRRIRGPEVPGRARMGCGLYHHGRRVL